jgi:homocysteine S-methyltransferase
MPNAAPFSDPIAQALSQQPVFILDGALATELEKRGANLNDPLWSAKLLIEQPDLIGQVHFDYFMAGADVATTASYQATFEAFQRRGYSREEAASLMRKSITLALQARDAFWAEPANRVGRIKPLVAASVGPYGAMLADGSEYRGNYGLSQQALADFHRPRMQVLANAGADLLACETLPCLDEALAIASLLPEFAPMAAWVSFSCKDGEHNSQGEKLTDCMAQLDGVPQIVAVGVNCTAPEFIPSLVAQARQASTKPIVVYPNSGEHYDAANKQWNGCSHPSNFAQQAQQWYAYGARLIGGCCRTGPEDIAALSRIFKAE